MALIKRGDVFWVNFDPTMGSEAKKTRPAVVVSNDINNQHSPIVSICPITSNVNRIYTFEVEVPQGNGGLQSCSKIMANQTRAVDKLRLVKKLGHFSAEIMVENFMREINGEELKEDYDGHANCFIETGFEKAALIDFNYEYEPLPGKFPLPGLGPFSLLGESKANHWGKMMFKWVYWNLLLSGQDMPLEPQMEMAGKHWPKVETE